MAQIDLLLARLVQGNTSASATMRADAPVEVVVDGRSTQGSVVSEAALQAILGEILPDTLRDQLDRKRVFQFAYESPHGVFFDIAVNPRPEKLEVTVRPASTSAATASARAQIPCPHCGASNETTAAFCFACGQAMVPQAPAAPRSTSPRPEAPSQAPSQAGSSFSISTLWAKVAPFARLPWGCVTVPAMAYGALVALALAMALAPLLLALAASKYLWNSTQMPRNKKQLSIAGIVALGLMLNAAFISLVNTLNPQPPVATVIQDDSDPSRPAPTNPRQVAAAPVAPVAPLAPQAPAAPAASSGGVNDLQLDGLEFKAGAFGMGVVTGTIRNTGGQTFNYVQVEVNGYDASGAQVGSTLANINNLEPGGRWNFETMPLSDKAVRVKVKEITAW